MSEVMLAQTPVARVLPAYAAWLARWPTPAALAAEAPGEAVRQWGRLGYPRRALRLHAAARVIVDRHGGEVPAGRAQLLSLPGVGEYTARAVASFAFGQRHAVVDTNVRRVLARAVSGRAAARPATTAADLAVAEGLLPPEPATAARFGVALMELGALVCTARAPRCGACPLADRCAWRLAGSPPGGPPGRAQPYAGTDRQVRGRILALLRDSPGPVAALEVSACWTEPGQLARALASLVVDGLVVVTDASYHLPR